jgi:phosphoglycerate kinase
MPAKQPMRTLDDLDLDALHSVVVFVRVDFNVPLADGRVADNARLEAALPTLNELRRAGARLLLASHCGRPGGARVPELSLKPVAAELERLLGAPVVFAADCIGVTVEKAVSLLAPGSVAMLENLRFHAGEKANDPEFAARLAAPAEVFVNDAFGTAHRAHASTVGVAERLARRAAGRLLVREVEVLEALLADPERPFAAVLGGAKISGKADTLANLLPRVDLVALGGAMANTFLAARQIDLGRSLVERERLDLALEILAAAEERGVRIILPTDLVVTDNLERPGRVETVPVSGVPTEMMAVDIGPATCSDIADSLRAVGTIFWNGPMGVFEQPPFDAGTSAVASAVADSDGRSVIGGGDTLAAVRRAGVSERIGHVSTGGGAALKLLAGQELPGVEILRRFA